jgi:hypothetical protein
MYEVSFSGLVIQLLRELAARNPTRVAEIDRVLKHIERLLRVYPQYGQPLSDLSIPNAQRWVMTIAPFVVHYAVVEADDSGRRRQVMVTRPFALLPKSGLV